MRRRHATNGQHLIRGFDDGEQTGKPARRLGTKAWEDLPDI